MTTGNVFLRFKNLPILQKEDMDLVEAMELNE
jgi:hypothetical protein